tara:strand:+ start:97 stop:342 length:246 start_codon:yes stop_codon:yes gene_type:complete
MQVRARAYRDAFNNDAGRVVIADLARFCHYQTTTHVPGDTHGTAQLEGRRQVFLRIQGYHQITDDRLHEIAERAAMLEREE